MTTFKKSSFEWSTIEAMNAGELAKWLTDNFTPARYQSNNDIVKEASYRLYGISPWPKELVQEFIARLWGSHGELPDELPNFDSYGRLSTLRPNYDKPGMAERVRAFVDEIEPSYQELYRKGRA